MKMTMAVWRGGDCDFVELGGNCRGMGFKGMGVRVCEGHGNKLSVKMGGADSKGVEALVERKVGGNVWKFVMVLNEVIRLEFGGDSVGLRVERLVDELDSFGGWLQEWCEGSEKVQRFVGGIEEVLGRLLDEVFVRDGESVWRG